MNHEAPPHSGQRAIAPVPALDITLSPVVLDPRVTPANVPAMIDFPNRRYLETYFDYTTLLYDIFRDIDGKTVHAIGPALPRTVRPMRDIEFIALPSATVCRFAFEAGADCVVNRYRFVPPAGTDAIQVQVGGQTAIVAIQPNLSHLFAGRKTLLTIVHDNPLTWIVDWVTFHVRQHGVDAVLVYDNNSTAYDSRDLRRTIAAIPGIAQVVVIPWHYGYGINPPNVGFWAQPGSIVHAQRRMLARAEWVIGIDIDELVVRLGDQRIEDLLASSTAGWFVITSQFLAPIRSRGSGPLRHRDLFHVHEGLEEPFRKLLIVPSRLGPEVTWHVHDVFGGEKQVTDPQQFRVFHFLPLTTANLGRADRLITETLEVTPFGVEVASRLQEILDEVFPDDEPAPDPAPWTELEGNSSGLAARRAKELLAAGDPRGALPFIDHAIRLNRKDRYLKDVRLAILDRIATHPPRPSGGD